LGALRKLEWTGFVAFRYIGSFAKSVNDRKSRIYSRALGGRVSESLDSAANPIQP